MPMKLCFHAAETKISCRGNYCFPPRETFGNISSSKRVTDSSRLNTEVSNVRSGCSGASKGAETPVKSLISPRRAFAYNPLTSRRSHSSIGVLTYISRKFSFPTIDAAISLKSLFGLIKAAIVITPVSIKSLLTSAIRRIFSTRSSAEKPRLLLIPLRILSPSRMRHSKPHLCNSRSSAIATVLFPEPL